MGILLSVTAFKSLLTAIHASSKKRIWLVYIIICHLIFVLFLCRHQGVLGGAWAAVLISFLYFLIYFRYENKISYPVGFCVILLAVFIQSAQVYGCLDNKLLRIQNDKADFLQNLNNPQLKKPDLYYASFWFNVLNQLYRSGGFR